MTQPEEPRPLTEEEIAEVRSALDAYNIPSSAECYRLLSTLDALRRERDLAVAALKDEAGENAWYAHVESRAEAAESERDALRSEVSRLRGLLGEAREHLMSECKRGVICGILAKINSALSGKGGAK